MLYPIGQTSRILGFAQAQIFHSISLTQQNTIKKVALISSLVLGIACALYALYKVASFCFSKPKSPPPSPVMHPATKTPPSTLIVTPAPKSSPPSPVMPLAPTSPSPTPVVTLAPTATTIPFPAPAVTPAPKSAKLKELEKKYERLLQNLTPKNSIFSLIVIEVYNQPDCAIELIDFALTQGFDIDVVDSFKRTALHYSSWNVKVVSHILACGANPNAQDSSGNTPLHYAEKLDIIKVLIDKDSLLDITNSNDRTVLETHFANYIEEPYNQEREEIVEFLLTKGAKLHAGNYKGELLKQAFEKAIKPSFVRDGDPRKKALDIANKLIALGADLKTSDPTGTVLVKCLREGINYSDEVKQVKDFLFNMADVLVRLVPTLSVCDPKGQLMVRAFERVIHYDSTLWDPFWRQYYLKVVDKLSSIGSVSLDTADPHGKLLKRILTDANSQYPTNKPSFLKPYYEVADKLIQMGEALEKSDPHNMILRDALEKALSHNDQECLFYYAIANELIARGATQTPNQKAKIDDFLKGLSDHKRDKLTKNVKF